MKIAVMLFSLQKKNNTNNNQQSIVFIGSVKSMKLAQNYLLGFEA